ncbi:MAG TPA: serine hydrolase domain-containing protein [Terriglobia bacterium]|nr:serine hydrolase domain-containing protein [Terriglobia bacterium]
MRHTPQWIVAITVLLSALAMLTGRAGESPAPRPSTVRPATIDAVLARAVDRNVVPGVVAVVADKDHILYTGAFGMMDVAKNKPMQKDAIFRIASMTKPVTTVAAMMLIEEGKLSLDDPVAKYIPSFKNRPVVASYNPKTGAFTTKAATQEVRIRHLLSNTSGLAYTFANDEANRIQQKLKKNSDELPLLYEPGSQWTYGASARVMGVIIQKITGKGLDQFFRERIFKALALEDTDFAVPADKMNRLATVHRRRSGKLVEEPNPEKVQWGVAGDGGLNSTAADYIRFLQMFLNDGKTGAVTMLRPASIQAMASNQIGDVIVRQQVTTDPSWSRSFPIGAGRDKFGFGFQIATSNKENPNLRAPGSYTWVGIFNTHFWVDPQRGIAAVILMQVLPFYDEDCIQLYQDFEAAVGRELQTG